MYLCNAFVEGGLSTEDSRVRLHRLLHRKPNLRRRLRAVCVANLVEESYALKARFLRNSLVWCPGSEGVFYVVRACTSEDYDVKERVGAKTVCSVHRNACSFAGGVEARNNFVLAIFISGDRLTRVPGRNTAHCIELRGVLSDSWIRTIVVNSW